MKLLYQPGEQADAGGYSQSNPHLTWPRCLDLIKVNSVISGIPTTFSQVQLNLFFIATLSASFVRDIE